MTQGALIFALLALLALGVGCIALIAFLSAKGQEQENGGRTLTAEIRIDDALELHRKHLFLKRHPEWEGRDFVADRTSPWYTEPEFRVSDSRVPETWESSQRIGSR